MFRLVAVCAVEESKYKDEAYKRVLLFCKQMVFCYMSLMKSSISQQII
jgi:hypothetical protein